MFAPHRHIRCIRLYSRSMHQTASRYSSNVPRQHQRFLSGITVTTGPGRELKSIELKGIEPKDIKNININISSPSSNITSQTQSTESTSTMPTSTPSTETPKHIAVLLFPGFQLLDASGPLDALHLLSLQFPLQLSVLATTLEPVGTQNSIQTSIGSTFSPAMMPTHTFANAPSDIDVLIVPGGLGSRGEGSEKRMEGVVEFLNSLELDKKSEERSGRGKEIKYVLTVCTGSEILARTHLLDGRQATTNKRVFNDVKKMHPAVNWIAKARWVTDGDIWTSSGVSAGMDLVFAWMAHVWGEDVAKETADRSEYVRNGNAVGDKFADRWGAK